MNLARVAERDPDRRRADLLARMTQRRDAALADGDKVTATFWSDYIRDLQDS